WSLTLAKARQRQRDVAGKAGGEQPDDDDAAQPLGNVDAARVVLRAKALHRRRSQQQRAAVAEVQVVRRQGLLLLLVVGAAVLVVELVEVVELVVEVVAEVEVVVVVVAAVGLVVLILQQLQDHGLQVQRVQVAMRLVRRRIGRLQSGAVEAEVQRGAQQGAPAAGAGRRGGVRALLAEAQDPHRLSRMYIGWSAWT
ncbi:hypothetical protein TSOC_013304, partial [Tetrabaena socialis]